MNEHPFAVGCDEDGDWLHGPAAGGFSVAGEVVDVAAPEALVAVVPLGGAEGVGGDGVSAFDATERFGFGHGDGCNGNASAGYGQGRRRPMM